MRGLSDDQQMSTLTFVSQLQAGGKKTEPNDRDFLELSSATLLLQSASRRRLRNLSLLCLCSMKELQ